MANRHANARIALGLSSLLVGLAPTLILSGCLSSRYDFESGQPEEWTIPSERLREPYWKPGDELLQIDRIDLLVTQPDGSLAPELRGFVKYIRLRGEHEGHVVRFVHDANQVLRGVILPEGRTLRYRPDETIEVGQFGYSRPDHYEWAVKNILNLDGKVQIGPWDGNW